MKKTLASVTAILLAAGKSERAGRNKLWADVHGRPLWTLSYEALQSHPEVDRVILVVPKGEVEKFAKHADCKIVAGGDTRIRSFLNGLAQIKFTDEDIIIDHNAANPNVTAEEISAVVAVAKEHGAAAISLPAVDTVFTTDGDEYKELLNREKLRFMQTPQASRGDKLRAAKPEDETDLSSALIKTTNVKIVDGNWANQKITFASDLSGLTCNSYLGEDSHAFEHDGKGELMLGGLKIPFLPAMKANSDGDVILHAIGRALAQAQGTSFAEIADKMCESGELDSKAYLKLLLKGLKIHNISVHIEAARPHIDRLPLKSSLSKILGIPADAIHVSAMSGESLTSFGQGKGIRCACIINCWKA